MSTRTDQAVALRRATFRSVRWQPAFVAVLIVTVMVIWKNEAFDGPGSAMMAVRTVAVLLAVGTAFVLDDAAAITVAATPTPLWWRRMLRYGVAALFVLPTWLAVLGYAHSQQPDLPWQRLSIELAVLVTFGLAVGAAATRWWDAVDSGMTAALSVLGFVFIAAYLPPRVALFTAPDSASWEVSTLRWIGVLAVAGLVLFATNRDPARSRGASRGQVRRVSSDERQDARVP